MNKITIKEVYEIIGHIDEYERSNTMLPGLWPITKISYGFDNPSETTFTSERNYIILHSITGEKAPWWITYQRKFKFILSNGETVIIDASKEPAGKFGTESKSKAIQELFKFIDEFNNGTVGNLYNMVDDTFEDI